MPINISVIIPTCNRIDLLEKCLQALSPEIQNLSNSTYEIIVTDDSSDNITKDVIKVNYPTVIYHKGPRRGPASNRNSGAKEAKGKWLIFIDDDCIPDNNLLNNYNKEFVNEKYKVFEGKIYADRPRMYYKEEAPLNLNGGKMWSCNIAINRDLFFQLDGFEENFPFAAMEDVELHYRIKEKEIPIKFIKDAAVMHPWRKHPGLHIISKRQKSFIYLLKKHPKLLKKHNLKWFILNIKNNVTLFLKYFRIIDIPFVIIKNILFFGLLIKVQLLKVRK